jgi:protein-disulfide isomerase
VTNKVKNSERQMQVMIIGGIIGLVIIAIAIFVALQIFNKPVAFDYANIHQERTADGAFILGDPAAPITIVAFEDFLCPHCQSYQPEIHAILEQYVATGKARFEFRMLPVNNMSAVSFGLAECADELQPVTFWQAHDLLFTLASTTRFDQSSPRQFAEEMGLSYGALLECLETADQYQIDGSLADQYDEAITGTPSVVWRLNGGDIRFDIIPRRPTAAQIGSLLELAEQSQ